MTFKGHLKVTNVKIANIFLMVRDKHMVTMKHLWEVDIGLSESKTKLTPADLDGIISRSRKGRSIPATVGLLVMDSESPISTRLPIRVS